MKASYCGMQEYKMAVQRLKIQAAGITGRMGREELGLTGDKDLDNTVVSHATRHKTTRKEARNVDCESRRADERWVTGQACYERDDAW